MLLNESGLMTILKRHNSEMLQPEGMGKDSPKFHLYKDQRA